MGQKRGDEIKNKIFSSETAEPISIEFAEIIFRWSPFKIVSVSAIVKMGIISKFIKNPVMYVKKLIIMLIQFKFGHFLA
jgi:hypothetical protein